MSGASPRPWSPVAFARAGEVVRWSSPCSLSRRDAGICAAVSVSAVIAGLVVYQMCAPRVPIVRVELGGAGQPWPFPAGATGAIRWDFAFIAGYGIALTVGLLLAWAVLARPALVAWPTPDPDGVVRS